MMPRRGLSSPVIVPSQVDLEREYSETTLGELLALSDQQLAAVDPLAMNLIVAKGIPSLADLDIRRYQEMVDDWVLDLNRRCMPTWRTIFRRSPGSFKHDARFFRLGMVCRYLDEEVGIEYNVDQRDGAVMFYTNPSDLFLNGVLDTHRGTCANMAALQMAIGWRMGWPVSLACVNAHYILRFDDGTTIYNIEATQAGHGGFKSDPDDYLIETKRVPAIAIQCGSDLRALRPREVLGEFVGLRARHLQDLATSVAISRESEEQLLSSEPDWLLARYLFPCNRGCYRNQMTVATLRGNRLFEPHELGHPNTYSRMVEAFQRKGVLQMGPSRNVPEPSRECDASLSIDKLFSVIEVHQ